MNIFATGMNPADANALKRAPRVAIFQAFAESMKYLQDTGESVTWRRHRVGDPLPSWTEAVIVSSMLPRSLNCPYALGVMWVMHQALEQKIPLVVYLTDWAFFKANSEFKSIAKAGPDYFFKQIGGAPQYNEDPTAILEHGDALIELCRQYNDPNSLLWERAKVLVPRYTNWGDVSIVQNLIPGRSPVYTLDPTPLFLRSLGIGRGNIRVVSRMGNRRQEWVLPSLLKNDDWLDKQYLRWPIHRFGPKGFEVLPTEQDIHMEYRRSVGAICPPYPTVGSGWWRSRWIHSAFAGSVLLCDSKDAAQVGPEYHFSGREYETMSTLKLDTVADQQSEKMLSLLQYDEEVFHNQLHDPFLAATTSPSHKIGGTR